jgi:hypothetical protein
MIDGAPTVDIGGSADDPHDQLSNIGDVVRLGDGRIAVMNNGTSELRFYDSLGHYLSASGRAGDGPGEFRGVERLVRAGDSVIAYDYQLRRITTVTPAGGVGGTTPVTAALTTGGVEPIGRVSDGSWIGRSSAGVLHPAPAIQRDTVVIVRLSTRLDSVLNEIGRFPATDEYITAPPDRPAGTVRSYGVPFGLETYVVVRGDLIYVGDAARYEVLVYRPDGRLVRRIRREVDREPVRDADVSRARQEEILRAGPRYAEAIERRWALVPVPATKPAFSGIALDDAGRLTDT